MSQPEYIEIDGVLWEVLVEKEYNDGIHTIVVPVLFPLEKLDDYTKEVIL